MWPTFPLRKHPCQVSGHKPGLCWFQVDKALEEMEKKKADFKAGKSLVVSWRRNYRYSPAGRQASATCALMSCVLEGERTGGV